MECLQILDRTGPAEVKGVLAKADVTGGITLALGNMGEFVLDHRALPQGGPADGRLDLLTEAMLERLVFADGHGAAVAELGRRALRAQGAAIADVGIELDHRAEGESLHVPIRTGDGAVTKMQRKGGLRKQAA